MMQSQDSHSDILCNQCPKINFEYFLSCELFKDLSQDSGHGQLNDCTLSRGEVAYPTINTISVCSHADRYSLKLRMKKGVINNIIRLMQNSVLIFYHVQFLCLVQNLALFSK